MMFFAVCFLMVKFLRVSRRRSLNFSWCRFTRLRSQASTSAYESRCSPRALPTSPSVCGTSRPGSSYLATCSTTGVTAAR